MMTPELDQNFSPPKIELCNRHTGIPVQFLKYFEPETQSRKPAKDCRSVGELSPVPGVIFAWWPA
jgi:hypothetical protein